MHCCAHVASLRRILCQPGNCGRQVLGAGVALIEEQGCASVYEALGVLALMVVGGGGQGDEDRGPACDGQLGQGQGAGTRDDEVGIGVGCRHVVDEGLDLHALGESEGAVAFLNAFEIGGSGLVYEALWPSKIDAGGISGTYA